MAVRKFLRHILKEVWRESVSIVTRHDVISRGSPKFNKMLINIYKTKICIQDKKREKLIKVNGFDLCLESKTFGFTNHLQQIFLNKKMA